MASGDNFPVWGLDWFKIYFTENPGMAFGIELGGSWGKIALSLFRVVAVSFIGWYLHSFIKQKMSYTLLFSVTLIFAGALGNIIDSAFYGVIFSESTHYGPVAQFLPEEGGYAGFLYGKVVDMLYFPLYAGTYPEWFPFVGGESFLFFQAIFNVADAAITVGVVCVMLFYRKFAREFAQEHPEQEPELAAAAAGSTARGQAETEEQDSRSPGNEEELDEALGRTAIDFDEEEEKEADKKED